MLPACGYLRAVGFASQHPPEPDRTLPFGQLLCPSQTGGCVGAGNRRWFLLLLYWTLVACAYIAVMASLVLRRRWDVVSVCWAVFKREFAWTRAYLMLWWIAKVRLENQDCNW